MKKTLFTLFILILFPLMANAAPKTDTEIINEAISAGDCAALYEYVNRDKTEPALVTSANNAIKRYTTIDGGTPKYRTNKMDGKVRRVPQETMDKIFKDPKANLPDVVTSLATGVTDQFMKAKILHDWICDNIVYDTDMYFSGRVSAQDYISVLKKKKAVCSGYTNLYNKMCELAGIESIGIEGYSKGFGYSGKIGANTDHAWNALKIGTKWYLVDVTWDAGHVDRKTYIKNYSTDWLFLDSRPFLYSHLAQKEKQQFYAPVLSATDFMREAYIAGSFFAYGLALKDGMPEYNNSVDNGFSFDLVLRNTNVSLSDSVQTPQGRNVESAAWAERKGSSVTFDFDVPDSSEYKGHIFARFQNEVRLQETIDIGIFEERWLPSAEKLFIEKKITEKERDTFKAAYFKVADNGNYYFAEDQFDTFKNNTVLKIHKLLGFSTMWRKNVLDFNIKALHSYQGFGKIQKYPQTFSTYNDVSNTQLISPKNGVLKSGATETFVLSSKDYTSFAIILDGNFNFFTKNAETGNFELTFDVPSNIDTLKISGGKNQRSMHWGLVQYNVIQ